MHVSFDGRLNGAVLKGQIGIVTHRAVLHIQILAVAEGLFACDMASYQAQVLAVPPQVLAIYLTIYQCYILCVPEGILAVQ